MFSLEQGYYVAYNFLEEYWQTIDKNRVYPNKGSFTLVTIISTMDPESINHPSPIDSAKYEDWKIIMKNLYNNKTQYTSEEIYIGMIEYLKFYQNEFDFNIQNIIEDISNNFIKKYINIWHAILNSL